MLTQTQTIRYTNKLLANLNSLKKAIKRINSISDKETRREEIKKLYKYFKQETDEKVKLFNENDEEIYTCLTVEECIERDIEYLENKCDEIEEKNEHCKELVTDIGKEFKRLIDAIKEKAEQLLEEDITEVFINKLKTENEEELKYISDKLNINLSTNNIETYKDQIKELLYSCYKTNEDEKREYRIKWIVYGYLSNNNRNLEDWLPSVNSRFQEYNDIEKKIPVGKRINFNEYKNSGGLKQLENILKTYGEDKKNYKKFNNSTDQEIDFSKHKKEIKISYTYKDPYTDKNVLEVIEPKTRESAVYWGWETKWCTSRIDPKEYDIYENNLFESYYENSFLYRLYILKVNGKIKYQIYFDKYQFMDINDDEVQTEKNPLNEDDIKIIENWMKYLIDNKNLKDKIKVRLLLFSSKFNLINIVNYLIDEHNIDINSKDKKRYTSLIISSQYGQEEMVKHLIRKGANLNIKDSNGHSSLMWASENGHLNVVKILIENGIKVDSKNMSRNTSLMWASYKGHLDVVKYLINNGANVNHKDNYKTTSLMWASENGHLEIVKYLIENGAESHINNKGENFMYKGYTSLMIALDRNHLQIVNYLLSKGADVNIRNYEGKTCLTIAKEKGYSEIIELLLSHGATE